MSSSTSKRRVRPAPLSIRLSIEQRCRLVALAGNLSVSSYIKSVLFSEQAAAPRRQISAIHADRQLQARILAALGQSRLANKLNQLAHAANSGSLFCDDQTTALLMEACEAIGDIRTLLMHALGKQTCQHAEREVT